MNNNRLKTAKCGAFCKTCLTTNRVVKQVQYINDQAKKMLKRGNPVISVDTKKKEMVGNFKNNGKEWHKTKKPRKVKDYDFPSPDIPHAYPYGAYDKTE